MALDQEHLIATLYARLQEKLPDVEFWTRRFTGWEDLPVQPAAVLEKVDASAASEKGMPTRWTVTLDLSIFYKLSEDRDVPADLEANVWLQKVEAALERTPQEQALANSVFMDMPDDPRTTLGGLCSHCWINGTVDTDSGALGGQGVLVIPIEILATA